VSAAITVTLDQIARDPAKAAGLSAEQRGPLLVQAAAVLAALGAAMARHEEHDGPDRLLTVKEAAPRVSMSEDYLYRHYRELPFWIPAPNGARAVRFSERGIERYLRQQQERQAS
jgi:predicted DNA-binding transcriptional regulator AlpA